MSVRSLIAALVIAAAVPVAAHAGTCAGNQVRGASGTWETISPVAGVKSFGGGDCSTFAAASTSDDLKPVATAGVDAAAGLSLASRSSLTPTAANPVFGVSSLGAGALRLVAGSSSAAPAAGGGGQEAVMLFVLGVGLLGWVARRTRSRG